MVSELADQLTDYYSAAFPAHMRIEISDLKPITSGIASDVYSFMLGYDVNGETQRQSFVLKCYSPDSEGMDRALKERHALERLSAAGYPVPRASLVETDTLHLGRPFLVMERVEGQVMWDAIQTADDDERQALTERFVGLLADLHALSSTVMVTNLKVRDEYTLIKREIHNLRIMATDQPAFLPVVDWLHARRDTVPCPRPCITHRDFHPWNVLLTGDGGAVVLDWGWQIGDPRFDVAWTLTLLRRSGYDEFAADVLAAYERRTGVQVNELTYFEVLATLRWLLVVLDSLRSGVNLRNGARASLRSFLTGMMARAVELIQDRTGILLPRVEELLG